MSIRVIDLEKRHPGSGAPALRGLSCTSRPGEGRQRPRQERRRQDHAAALPRRARSLRPGLHRDRRGHRRRRRRRRAPPRCSAAWGWCSSRSSSSRTSRCSTTARSRRCAPAARPRADAEERALELLDRLGLADKAERLPRGALRRAAAARRHRPRARVEPRVLLYDEPTSALDPSLKQEVGRDRSAASPQTGHHPDPGDPRPRRGARGVRRRLRAGGAGGGSGAGRARRRRCSPPR